MQKVITNGTISVPVNVSAGKTFKDLKEAGADIGLTSLKYLLAGTAQEAKGFRVEEVEKPKRTRRTSTRPTRFFKIAADANIENLRGRYREMIHAIADGDNTIDILVEKHEFPKKWVQHEICRAKAKNHIEIFFEEPAAATADNNA